MPQDLRQNEPELRRLPWAGIELTRDGARVLIDPLQDTEPLEGFLGTPRSPLGPVEIDEHTWALVTHLHPDHYDRVLLRRLARGQVLCHQPVADQLRSDGVSARGVELWERVEIGSFWATPVPSHDWRGDDQVAWVVETDGKRVIHCGDTIWHGSWYRIHSEFDSFDAAFLPINAVLARLEGFTPTEVPATMTPEQAIEAAVILRADVACAIHHQLFNNPPLYVEGPDVIKRFLAAGERRGIHATAPEDGAAIPIR
jgi:L-ascorbate metabolism protein UlaG (beta-lactamase superfamily)